MAKLTVTLNGEVILEKTLEREESYILGRAPQCDVVLEHARVSRQHAKITFSDNSWICQLLSKHGKVTAHGKTEAEFTLEDQTQFEIGPFQILFTEEADENVEAVEVDDKTEDLGEKTRVGGLALRAFLRLRAGDGAVLEEYEITKSLVAGRSAGNDIIIKDPHASRRHFVIDIEGDQYVLRDLESANKTYVNGHEISNHRLQSGDEIQVGDDLYIFEIEHSGFENLPSVVYDRTVVQGGSAPAVIRYRPQENPIAHFFQHKKRLIKIGLLVFVMTLIAYGLSQNEPPPQKRQSAGTAEVTPGGGPTGFDRLPPEQRKFIEDTYNLAISLSASGKYDLAAIEFEKILRIVKEYKDTKNILVICQQNIELRKQQEEAERQQKELEAMKQRISDILDKCDDLLRDKQYSKVSDCVAQVNDLDPENERALNLKASAQQAMEEIENSKELKEEMARKKASAEKSYQLAKRNMAEKRYPAALAELTRVEKASFPDSASLKEKARQDIKTVKEKMLKESQAVVAEGKSALEAKDFSNAISKFNQALALAPFNSDAKSYKAEASKQLHLEMKNLYAESVIEENLGNIESAKKKWATIIKTDEKTDEYYQKATIKLHKYER